MSLLVFAGEHSEVARRDGKLAKIAQPFLPGSAQVCALPVEDRGVRIRAA